MTDSTPIMETDAGQTLLIRHPKQKFDPFLPYDSADRYLVNRAIAEFPDCKHILTINDEFGAISIPLNNSKKHVTAYTDYASSSNSIKKNWELNNSDTDQPNIINDIDLIPRILEKVDLVIVKTPKNHGYIEQLLATLKKHYQGPILFGVMAKHLTQSTVQVLEKHLDDVNVSLAWKKARTIIGQCSIDQHYPMPKPSNHYMIPNTSLKLKSHPNVFAQKKVDIGALAMIDTFDSIKKGAQEKIRVLDLASGNGILGIYFQSMNPDALIDFTDNSFQAVSSTEKNYFEAFQKKPNRTYFQDCLEESLADLKEQYDLILCNPPFHEQKKVGEHIARRMIADAYKMLKPDGELRLVFNRHLNYPHLVKKVYGGFKTLHSSSKFIVISAFKRKQ